jgi:acetyl-CoA C-acetyltransferase
MNPQTPVIIGAGQYTQRWEEGTMPLEPLQMIEKIYKEVAHPIPHLAGKIDSIFITNIFGYQYADAPTQLVEMLALENVQLKEFSPLGGNTPQHNVNRVCKMLEAGEIQMALLAGAEANYSLAKAMKSGLKLAWTPSQKPSYISGENKLGTTDLENNYELFLLTNAYPIFETAYRYYKKHTPQEHLHHIAHLYAPFAKVAAQNSHAWQNTTLLPEEIYTTSPENRYIAYPYTKRMCANNQVDQAALLLLTTQAIADELNVPQDQRVYPTGGADLNDIWNFSSRPDLAKSEAIHEAGKIALAQAQLTLAQIDAFDIYSCFPIAIQVAQDALNILPEDTRPLTITGGLAYFGGAWNNYSMHAIVQAVENIRQKPQNILITALGWYITKHAIGIYSALPTSKNVWNDTQKAKTLQEIQLNIDLKALPAPVERAEGAFEIVGYTLTYQRDGTPNKGIALGKIGKERAWAFIEGSAEQLLTLEKEEWVGKVVHVYFDEKKKRNIIAL